MEQVIVLGDSVSVPTDLPLSMIATEPRTSEPLRCEASSSARRAMIVACVVPQLPEASFFEEMKLRDLRTISEASPHFSRAWAARPVVSTAALSPLEYTLVSSTDQKTWSSFCVRASMRACMECRVNSRSFP